MVVFPEQRNKHAEIKWNAGIGIPSGSFLVLVKAGEIHKSGGTKGPVRSQTK
jgi:hypothetical protein